MYKKLFPLMMLALAFGLNACKQDQPAEESTVAENADPSAPVIEDAMAVSGEGLPVVVGPSGQISPQTRSVLEALTKDYWYVEQWVEMSQGKRNRETGEANRGRWFQFAMDGTLKDGKLKKENDTGTWIYDPQKAYLSMDMKDGQDLEFSLKMTPDGRVMLWVGTERFNQNNIQLKLENYVEMMSEMPVPAN